MKVALLTLSVSRSAGGMLDCVRGLARCLQNEQEIAPEILTLADVHTGVDLPGWHGLPVHVFPRRFGFAASGMRDALNALDIPLAHTHGLWSYCSPVIHGWARRTGRPYLVSPQGMLDAWALRNSRWKKRIAALLFEQRHLRNAACLHAVCAAEADAIRAYGLRNPICIVPNGVNLPLEVDFPAGLDDPPLNMPKTLLFLGRLHPKKGLPNLLRAWARCASDDPHAAKTWRLRIAGWDQGNHARELRELVANLRLGDAVEFAGPLYGDAKAEAFRHANAFVLPSFSEGLPLSVLEAWSYRLPVLMTPECNIPEGFSAGAALRADPDVASLAAALEDLFRAAPSALQDMGNRGRTLVEQKFTWSAAARAMSDVYRWIADGAPQPDCIVTR